jgi:hypothetical protein
VTEFDINDGIWSGAAATAVGDGSTAFGFLTHDQTNDYLIDFLRNTTAYTNACSGGLLMPADRHQGLNDEYHQVSWYNPDTGEQISSQLVSGRIVSIDSPSFARALVFIIKRH